MKSFKQSVEDAGFKFYGDEPLIPKLPKEKGKVELFTLGEYVTDNQLEWEYEKRGLVPAHPQLVLDRLQELDREFIGTHWKGTDEKWCCAAFFRLLGNHGVYASHSTFPWHVGWFFAGLRTSKASKTLPNKLIINGITYRKA